MRGIGVECARTEWISTVCILLLFAQNKYIIWIHLSKKKEEKDEKQYNSQVDRDDAGYGSS